MTSPIAKEMKIIRFFIEGQMTSDKRLSWENVNQSRYGPYAGEGLVIRYVVKFSSVLL